MLSQELKDVLSQRLQKYNVKSLLDFMITSNYQYNYSDLKGPLAMTTFDGIFIDVDRIVNDKMLYFIILHETAHYKRMCKIGKTNVLSNLSLENFEDFSNHVIYEELLADRYGSIMFYKLNNEIYPENMTQQLNNNVRRLIYINKTRGFFGVIQNSEELYHNFTKLFIKTENK